MLRCCVSPPNTLILEASPHSASLVRLRNGLVETQWGGKGSMQPVLAIG
jgi:hypothetical protein